MYNQLIIYKKDQKVYIFINYPINNPCYSNIIYIDNFFECQNIMCIFMEQNK